MRSTPDAAKPANAGPQGPETPATPPEVEYRRRAHACARELKTLQRRDNVFVFARLAAVVAAIGALVVLLREHVAGAAWSWLGVPVAAYVALAVGHARVFRARRRVETGAALWAAGLARIEDRWAGHGDAGERFTTASERHLFAADLDLYGAGGLFELLSVARTPVGQATLARWLEAPADLATVRARQAAVAELAPRLELREDLALAATAIKTEVRDEALLGWAVTAPAGLPAKLGPLRVMLALVAGACVTTFVVWLLGRMGIVPFLISLAAGWAVTRRHRTALGEIAENVGHRADELRILGAAMTLIEGGTFTTPALRALQAALATDGVPASRRIARLRRLVDLLDGRRNQFAALLMVPLQAAPQLALAIEEWRRATGAVVGRWMNAVGELEALVSLGTFAFEHPGYPFPALREAGASFVAEALGHPLIPAARRVVNDVSLGEGTDLLLVSGSNMSGKSTMLRTIGVNVVLALAGAPVCARRLALSPLQVGATLRINDSLQAGQSRFYAELTRLRQIVDHAGGTPALLFLLDEILHGTNSHDRRIGAEAIIRGLLARGAIGLVTTHDLALAAVADTLAPRAANVHFEDHLEDGRMTFDYRMRAGIVKKSNALALMRAVGLDVGEDAREMGRP